MTRAHQTIQSDITFYSALFPEDSAHCVCERPDDGVPDAGRLTAGGVLQRILCRQGFPHSANSVHAGCDR